MASQKVYDLIKQLYKLTLTGKITWAETASPSLFQYSFPTHSVQVGYETENPITDVGFFYLNIISTKGDVLDRITEGTLPEPYSIDLKNLYESARRIAKGVEKALDDLLLELHDIDTTP